MYVVQPSYFSTCDTVLTVISLSARRMETKARLVTWWLAMFGMVFLKIRCFLLGLHEYMLFNILFLDCYKIVLEITYTMRIKKDIQKVKRNSAYVKA